MGCLIMKRKTLLLALIPALLLAPSCSATKNTGGTKANDVVIKNETTNDKYGDSPVMLKADRHNVVNTATADVVAVSTSDVDGDLILSFAISESLESELLAAGVETVSVFYGYVPYEQDSVANDVVLERGSEVTYELSKGRIIRLIIKDRGTADYADKKYQGVLTYELNSTRYVSETQSISQTWETVTENLTTRLVARYSAKLASEDTVKYDGHTTYKITGTGRLTEKKVYSGIKVPTESLKGNFSGAKLSFAAKYSNLYQGGVFFKLTDESNKKIEGSSDAKCGPTLTSSGVSKEDLGEGWYKYTLDFSTAFNKLQTNQMIAAKNTEFAFSYEDNSVDAVVYISQVKLERQDKAALPTPTITLVDDTITWENVKNAAGYTVYKNGVEQGVYSRTDVLSYTDEDNSVGARELKVVAHTDGKGYFYESSASVIHKVIDETAESGDLSNNLLKMSNVTITQNDDATYNGAWSQKITGTKDSMCMKLMAKDLGGITGKTLTFYTQMVDASAVASGYLRVTFNYFDSSNKKLGQEPNHYLCFNTNHAAVLGTFEKLSGTNWMRSTIKLDDKLFGSVNPEEVSYLRIKINEQCIINFDAMSVTDTQAV